MRNWKSSTALTLGCVFALAGNVDAQGRGGADWNTVGSDAARDNWVRADAKISVEHLQKPGFGLAWKIKLNGEPTIASTLDRYIGYRGFRSFAFVGSASGELTTIDSDLGRVEWTKKIGSGPASRASNCTGGMTSNVSRPTTVAIAGGGGGFGGGGGGRGRGGAKSTVGQPGEGATTINPNPDAAAGGGGGGRGRGRGAAGQAAAAPGAPGAPGAPTDPNAGRRGGGGGGRQPEELAAVGSDGIYHSIYVSNGVEPKPPVPFLPANANARELTVLNGVAYAATAGSCGGAPNGIWALDLSSSQVSKWTTSGDVAGPGFAFGPDATLYAATSAGELVGLDPKTLQVKNTYKASAFSTAPLVFEYNEKPMLAAATQDGHLHLVDAASLSGAAYPGMVSGALASWQDGAGTRWILGPTKDAIAAWKVGAQGALQTGWTSAEMASPIAPIVVNGVVFTVSNSPTAVLHALDGSSGKELWNSGKMMTAAVRIGSLSSAGSQVYLGTSDGMIYAFAFPIEH